MKPRPPPGRPSSTDESVLLSVCQDGEVIYLDKVTSEQAVQTYTRIGGRNPAYAVASGKVLLAHQQDRELQRVLSRPLRAMTHNTITDPAKVRAELDNIRQRGYAVNFGECLADVNGVGAVMRDSKADPVAAISVSGPAYRFDREAIDRAVEPLIFTASTISKQLGYSMSLCTQCRVVKGSQIINPLARLAGPFRPGGAGLIRAVLADGPGSRSRFGCWYWRFVPSSRPVVKKPSVRIAWAWDRRNAC